MRKITFILMLLTMCVGTLWAQTQPVTGTFYRIKDNTHSKFLTIGSYNVNSTGAFGTVPVLEEELNADQMWELVEVNATNNQYKLHSKSGYYLQCRGWNCDAVSTGGSTIIIEAASVTDVSYYLKDSSKDNKYFKVQVIDNVAHPFCDAPEGNSDIVTWSFIEVPDAELKKAEVLKAAQNIVDGASNTRVGAYSASVAANLSAAMEAFNADKSDANYSTLETEYNTLVANPDAKVTLSAGEKFRVQCFDTPRGYMAYSTVEGKSHATNVMLAGTTGNTGWAEKFPALDENGVYADWAIVDVEGQNYIYNVEKQQCITYTTGGQKVIFSDGGTAITYPVFRIGTPKFLRVYFPQPGTTNLHSSDCSSSIPR